MNLDNAIQKLSDEVKNDELNSAMWTAEHISKLIWQELYGNKKNMSIDKAYDPPLTQLDIDPDWQG